MYKVKVIQSFTDLTVVSKNPDDQIRKLGDVFDIYSEERVLELLGNNRYRKKFIEIISSSKPNEERKGKKVIIYQGFMYKIGGIETFVTNLAKNFKDYNLTLMCESIPTEQLLYLSKYIDIVIDNHQRIDCDVFIIGNYDGAKILNRVHADKVYQMVHADIDAMTKSIPTWANYKWSKHSKIDKVISVSQSAADGLKANCGVESDIIYNILDDDFNQDEEKVFITLSRATPEKGINRVLELIDRFKAENKKFIWLMCSSLEQISDPKLKKKIKDTKEIIIIPPSIFNKRLIKGCDYLVQLSDTESFCYSAFEALQRGVPVILTDFPEARKIVDDGENGYILNKDLSNLDVDKIFNHKPTNIYYIDRCNKDDWIKVFKGEF